MVGWAASPRRATLPHTNWSNGSLSKMALMNGDLVACVPHTSHFTRSLPWRVVSGLLSFCTSDLGLTVTLDLAIPVFLVQPAQDFLHSVAAKRSAHGGACRVKERMREGDIERRFSNSSLDLSCAPMGTPCCSTVQQKMTWLYQENW